MKYSYALSIAALVAAVNAQSAPDFPIQVDENLRVDFQNTQTSDITTVDPPGILLSQDDILDPPTIFGPEDSSRTRTYMLFMIDQDVPSNGARTTLLHYFQPNLAGGSEVLFNDPDAPNFTSEPSVEYIAPTPPAGDGPHRYTFLAYLQPADFAIPDKFSSFFPPADTSARIGFDMASFAEAANLGQPLMANWMRVENGEAAQSGSTNSASASASTTSTAVETETTTASESEATTSTSETTSTETSAEAPTTTTVVSETASTLSTSTTTTEGSSEATASSSSDTGASASASASSSASPAGNAAGGKIDVRHSMTALAAGVALVIAGGELGLF